VHTNLTKKSEENCRSILAYGRRTLPRFVLVLQLCMHESRSLQSLHSVTFCLLMYVTVTGYLVLFTTQVTSEEFSQCYDDINICLWTNGSELTQSAAQSVCRQRNSFPPRITNSNIQSKLREFRFAAFDVLGAHDFWIDVKAVGDNNWQWLDNSSLAGHLAS